MEETGKIGNRIAELRKKAGLTQAELAEKLYVSDKAVSKWESGNGAPSTVMFPSLAELFGVTIDFLISGKIDEAETAKEPIETVDIFDKLALQKVLFDGDVVGNFGNFTVTQIFKNDTKKSLNVFYTFPISATGSVIGFEAKIGNKVVKGFVKEKQQAKKEYQKAIAKGDSAYLLENEDNNLFKVSVGRILAGEIVEIKLDYIDKFGVFNNSFDLRIPTLLPPRYNDVISSGQTYSKEIEYTADFTINFDKGMKIADITSATHSIKQKDNVITCKDAKLNKDFVLNIVLDKNFASTGLSYTDEDGEVYTIAQFMPKFETVTKHQPKQYIFIIDNSGSMGGIKCEKTKIAVRKALCQLKTGDKFEIICFGSGYQAMNGKSIDFNEENIKKAIIFINGFNANLGGTEIARPLDSAFERYGDNNTIILLTDGEVGNEGQIADSIKTKIKNNRLFIFGIDSSVNVSGLTKMANAGRGKAEFITPDEKLDDKILRQFARINGADIATPKPDANGNKIAEQLQSADSIFDCEYYNVITKGDKLTNDLKLLCDICGSKQEFALPLNKIIETQIPISKFFAKEKIAFIERLIQAERGDTKGYEEEIVSLAVKYQIDSRYTSFLAINERDAKVLDVPTARQTKLEQPASWGRVCGGIKFDAVAFESSAASPTVSVGSSGVHKAAASSAYNSHKPLLKRTVQIDFEKQYNDCVAFVKKKGEFTIKMLCEKFGFAIKIAKKIVTRMEKEGIIESYLDYDGDEVLKYRVIK